MQYSQSDKTVYTNGDGLYLIPARTEAAVPGSLASSLSCFEITNLHEREHLTNVRAPFTMPSIANRRGMPLHGFMHAAQFHRILHVVDNISFFVQSWSLCSELTLRTKASFSSKWLYLPKVTLLFSTACLRGSLSISTVLYKPIPVLSIFSDHTGIPGQAL